MDQIKSMLILSKVLDGGSLSVAAQELGVSPSAVSQHITLLEKYYNLKLLNRTTRKISPTAEGTIIWQCAKSIADNLAETQTKLDQLQTKFEGDVVISLPSGFIESPAIQRFIQQLDLHHPLINLILLPDDKVIDLFDNDIDIAIRATEPSSTSNLIARYLTSWELCICASPQYMTTQTINKPTDLLAQKWIKYHDKAFSHAFDHLDLDIFTLPRAIYCANIASARSLAISSHGLTFQLFGEIEHYLKQGILQQVLPECNLPKYNIYAVTTHRTQSIKVDYVLKLLKKCFK